MEFEYISAKDNKLCKNITKLMQSARERKKQGLFVLEGLRLCSDAAKNGYKIDTLIISEDFDTENDRFSATAAATERKVKMPKGLFASLCDTVTPQGVLAVVRIPSEPTAVSSIENGKFIILENLQDPANLGTVSRTAEALGISGIITSAAGCDPFSPKSLRASMGALLRLPVIISDGIVSDVELLRKKGFTVYASVVKNAECDIRKADFSGNCAVLIGNEANGLTAEAVNASDKTVTITMKGRAESLNAAAAASIIMWEMTGQ